MRLHDSSRIERLEPRWVLATAQLSIADAAIVEPDAGAVNLVFDLARTGDLTATIRATFLSAAGSAEPGVDYASVAGTITFASGATAATITVPVLGDTQHEDDESFDVNLTSIVDLNGPVATFAAKTDFSTGAQPFDAIMADFNGDGRLDLATPNGQGSSVSVLLGTTAPGAAAPTFAGKVDFTTALKPTSVAAGDFNGDGRLDLAVTSFQSTSVSVLLNTAAVGAAAPSFSVRTDFTVGSNPRGVVVADFNGDGRQDLAIANLNSDSVSVLLNATTVGAATPAFSGKVDFVAGGLDANIRAIAAADLNGDGRTDLAVADAKANRLATLVNTTAAGAAAPSFAGRQEFVTPLKPVSVVLVDLNGDGRKDLVSGNGDGNNASVLLNTTAAGAATLTMAARVDLPAGFDPFDVAAADVSGDGLPDLMVANRASNSISVFRSLTPAGATTAAFAAKVDIATASQPRSLAVGDVNGDGRPDVASGNYLGNSVSVLLNTTVVGGTAMDLALAEFAAGGNPLAVAAGDLNGDGRADAVTANSQSDNVSVLLNATAPGALSASLSAKQDFGAAAGPQGVALGDLNGDGRLDLVTANSTGMNVSVLLNTTSPGATTVSLAAKTDFALGTAPRGVALGDLNGDGRLDVVTAHPTGAVTVLLNTTAPGAATASFAASQTFATLGAARAVALGDLNGDGRPDLVTANGTSDTVSVLINATSPGSATAGFGAAQTFAAGSTALHVAVGDVNGDGRPDLAASDNAGIVSVLINTTVPGAGSASLAARVPFSASAGCYGVAIGDLSGDGRPDLAVLNGPPATVSLLRNTTAPGAALPSFAASQDASAGTPGVDQPMAIALADFNGDGRLDLATSGGVDSVAVLLSLPVRIVDGTAVGTIIDNDVTAASVAGRLIFYNNSSWDGNDATAGAQDDAAIATDKFALVPGEAATLVNYTSFNKGINGIMVDVQDLAGAPTAADFAFKTGNANDTNTWTPLATAPGVSIRPGAGSGGSDRITLIWADGTILKRWLQVTVRANASTGLLTDDVFYFGNAVGEAGNSAVDAQVNAADELAARGNPRNIANPAPVTFLFDYNRDKQVNAADQLVSRGNPTNVATRLLLIAPTPTALLDKPAVTPAAAALLEGRAVAHAAGAEGLAEAAGAGDNLDESIDTLARRAARRSAANKKGP